MNPPLKVLHLSHTLDTGGLERIVVELVRQAPALGLEPMAATLEEPGGLAPVVRELGAPVAGLNKRPGLDWSVVPRLRGLLRREGVAVVHAHNEGAGLYGGLAGRLAGVPVVLTRHGPGQEPGRKGRLMRRLVGRLVSRTACVSRHVMELVASREGVPLARLCLVYNGVDAARFAPDAEAGAAARAALGIASETPVVISVGRLAREKAYHLLLEAMASPGVTALGARLVLVGDGPCRAELEAKAGELGLVERAVFLGDRSDVPHLLNAADVFALSSELEGVSMAMLEAMACGLSVAATSVGGNPEVVEEGVTGLLTPSGDARALAQALGRLLADAEAARAMGAAGRTRVEERFSLAAMAGAYATIYRELAGKG